MDLAAWAVKRSLFSCAKAQRMKAETLDPACGTELRDAKLPEIREGLAASILVSANVDIEDGWFDVGEQRREGLLSWMPDTAVRNKARTVADVPRPLVEATVDDAAQRGAAVRPCGRAA